MFSSLALLSYEVCDVLARGVASGVLDRGDGGGVLDRGGGGAMALTVL